MATSITIRHEQTGDVEAIARLIEVAFQDEPHSSHTEQFIVSALRRSGKLTVSLVAVDGDNVVGHVAVSPIVISSGETEWCGLGPISVQPERQGQGIGSKLMKAALAEMRQQGARGCVVLGEPKYYGRFGFKAQPDLVLDGVPPEYFQAIAFEGEVPAGIVSYHEAFGVTE